MTNDGNDSTSLVIRKRMPVAREDLFEAWTDADTMRLWMCAENIISAEEVWIYGLAASS